ncbi:phytanoyl-CoA dioxygenase [Cryptomeria japonica]|uniref:phytanoyl-CoA dioxygenase n=1 Tax=Cryptomeria japonica TaxID=3369 RepID=UPI0027DA1C23|nr:phytanoyl-CoA dioxygenase [Cryptomeria japonica]
MNNIQGSLTAEQLQYFNSKGYLVIEGFANPEECGQMMQRMRELLEAFDPSDSSIFSSKNQQELTANHFYESAEKISFFFEERAFDNDGKLKQPKELSVNKVGHALHELDPVFSKFCCSAKLANALASLSYKRPTIIQSMYIFKQPGIGGEVVPHQDNSFLYTEPPSCTGLWLALEDATIENGCIWALPKSHKDGLVRRFLRDSNGVHFDKPSPTYDYKDFVPIEVKAGSLLVIHGDLVHHSFENKSPKSRHALSLHAVDTDGCTWAEDNWLQRKVAPSPIYVA